VQEVRPRRESQPLYCRLVRKSGVEQRVDGVALHHHRTAIARARSTKRIRPLEAVGAAAGAATLTAGEIWVTV
jgi:hypothetical protein